MSDSKVLCESYPRTNSNGSSSHNSTTNNNNNSNLDNDSPGSNNRRSPESPVDERDHPKTRSFLESRDHDRDRRSPRDVHEQRRSSNHGLDLSKPSPASQAEDSNGLDLSKPDMISANSFSRSSSDSGPYTNGIPSDNQPTPAPVSYAPGRSHSAGEAISPFRADSVPNGYSPDNLTNGGGYKSKFQEAYSKSLDGTSKYQENYGPKSPFDSTTGSGGMSSASSPTYPSKMGDSFIAAKLAEKSFPKPQDPYSKILEDYGNNVRNNNNIMNNNNAKQNEEFSGPGKLPESPYGKITESYAKQIESLANGYKTDPSSLSPVGFKNEPPPLGGFTKSETNLTNGSGYGSKTEAVSSSSSQPPSQSLPSILNFSTNHLRGMAAAESGLASYLNSYGVGGGGPDRGGENRSSGGGGSQGGSGGGSGGGSDSVVSRASPNNKLACRFCGKTFSQAGYIKAHERLHTGEKPFACSVCGKRFSDPSNWKKHERVHANNKKQSHLMQTPESKVKNLFIKSMSSLVTSSLQQRLAIRPDPGGPIMCKICGKMFSSQSSLSTHKRIHTGERPYRCSSCGKSFTQIGTLRTHERIHTGEKPYICKVCGRTFAQSGSYRMHERRHMTDSIQRCHICYATFTTWQDLQRHMASHPQVTQAILEFEEGNQGIIDRLNSGDLGGQLGDGSIGQLGHPDGESPGHGHGMLQGDCGPGGQRDLGVPHPRCPPPLIPESLLLDSEAAAFHVQSQGLYHTPGQLPPFSSILPFRHHPGGPPAFPPTFPSALGLLGTPVTSHAELLSKHSFYGAMNMALGAPQIKPDHLSKLSPTYSPQQHQGPQHLHPQQQQHPHHHHDSQQQHLQQQDTAINDGTDVVSTTSASKRNDADQRAPSRPFTPEERFDTENMTNLKEDKESSAFGRSVSSDDCLPSPDEDHMETNGEEDMSQDQEMADMDNDDDTDIDERYASNERGYTSGRRYSQNDDRGSGERDRDRERDRERGDRDRGGFGSRNRSRSFEAGGEKNRRDYHKERKPSAGGGGSGGSSSKNNNNNNSKRGDMDADDHDRDQDRDYDRDRGYDQSHSGRSSRNSLSWHDQNTDHKEKDDNSSLSNNNGSASNGNNNDNSDLRPPKRHIERQNLNTRMIPSSSSRKQRHPMRRFSSAGSEQEAPQSTSSLPVSSTTVEAIERGDLDDSDLVTFLLTKGRVHKCVHCHMIFEDASLFLLHNGFHAHDEPFRCVVCSAVCKDRIDFNCHLTSHIK